MRKPHWLKANRGGELPRYTFFVDTETGEIPIDDKSVTADLKFGYAAFCRRRDDLGWYSTQWYRFERSLPFWVWVTEQIPLKSKGYLFAHNLSFDLPVLSFLENLQSLGWFLTRFILDDPPTTLTFVHCPVGCGVRSGATWRAVSGCRQPHRKLEMIDTLNYFRMSLEKLGESIGVPKLEMPKLADGSPDWSAPPEVWEKYGQNDVEVLIQVMKGYFDFVTRHRLGNFSITLASQSFMAYRHRFMHFPIFIDDNEQALKLARSSYFGGRVECFFVGKKRGKFTKVDINSMYPYVMAAHSFPTRVRGFWQNVTTQELETAFGDGHGLIASVDLRTDEPAYPLYNERGKLLFPTGEFSTTLAGPELQYALEHGHIARIPFLGLYDVHPIFREYVHYFYPLRLQAKEDGNEMWVFFLKIMMNALYGKWGQTGRKWEHEDWDGQDQINVWAEVDGDTGEIHHFRQVGNIVQKLAGKGESTNSHPAIASYITSYARMYLWDLIRRCGEGNVFYCDTDCLIVNPAGLRALREYLDETELGMLKVEEQAQEIEIHGLKDYRLGSSIKLKGVRDPANPIAPNVFAHTTFRGFKGMLREGEFTVVITKGRKRLRREYDKGVVTESGWVTPIHLT